MEVSQLKMHLYKVKESWGLELYVFFCIIMSDLQSNCPLLFEFIKIKKTVGFNEILAVSNLFTSSVYVCICLLTLKNSPLLWSKHYLLPHFSQQSCVFIGVHSILDVVNLLISVHYFQYVWTHCQNTQTSLCPCMILETGNAECTFSLWLSK